MATKQDEHNWDLHLLLVMLVYRTSVQESTGCTPFELVFGRDARLPVDVMYGLPLRLHQQRRISMLWI